MGYIPLWVHYSLLLTSIGIVLFIGYALMRLVRLNKDAKQENDDEP